MNTSDYKPAEILEIVSDSGVSKAESKLSKLIVLSILAGAFIALAAQGSNMASFNLLADPSTYGMGRFVAGAIFSFGLMLVIIGSGDGLFTGNMLMIIPYVQKRISLKALMRNWGGVYLGNFIGAMLIVVLIYCSGQLLSADAGVGAMALKVAVKKVNLEFIQAIALGILCNWLVCMATWMASGAKSYAGKIMCIFFPITLFVMSEFEHSIANMYYVPIGIMAKNNSTIVAASGLATDQLASLTWDAFLINNLLPVTIGNLIGGAVFVGMAYYLAFREKSK